MSSRQTTLLLVDDDRGVTDLLSEDVAKVGV